MQQIFIGILNNAWVTSWLILAVIVVRLLLNKLPKYFICILWGVVGLSLMFSFELKSSFSLLPCEKIVESVTDETGSVVMSTGIGNVDYNEDDYVIVQGKRQPVLNSTIVDWVDTISIVWIVVAACMISYMLYSYFMMKRKVACSIDDVESYVSICDDIKSPFLLGVLKPHIYLPSGLEWTDREYVLLHEYMHIKRRDYLWKPLGFLMLSIYWFNPLCWISYFLLCKDIEMACDEMVIKKMDASQRAEYCQVLLNFSTGKHKMITVPVAFCETSVKKRVKNALEYKKPKPGIVIAELTICIGAIICFGTKPDAFQVVSLFGENDTYYSEVYSDEDINSAIDIIKTDFKEGMKGCTLNYIYYAGDDESKYYKEWYDGDEVIVLHSSFDVGMFYGEDVLSPNSEERWNWILVRNNGGQWEHVDHGY